MRLATFAASGAVKKNQAWAPFPDRERSIAAGTPVDRQVSVNAATSSCHEHLSKSTARNQQVSSSRSGYTPITCRPFR